MRSAVTAAPALAAQPGAVMQPPDVLPPSWQRLLELAPLDPQVARELCSDPRAVLVSYVYEGGVPGIEVECIPTRFAADAELFHMLTRTRHAMPLRSTYARLAAAMRRSSQWEAMWSGGEVLSTRLWRQQNQAAALARSPRRLGVSD